MAQQFVNNTQRPGTAVTLQALIQLRQEVLHRCDSLHQKKLFLSGQRLVNTFGRGIEYHATREYQFGDDIRNMAWRVMARSLKPHIKVYCEEKERPVWVVVDLSPSMYFGTKAMFKSVRAIVEAASAGWLAISKNERVGAVFGSKEKQLIFEPRSKEKDYLTILRFLAEFSDSKPTFNQSHSLHSLLIPLQKLLRVGNLIHIYSDFFELNAKTKQLISYLSKHSQVILNLVYDPFEAFPPPPDLYILTDGQQKMLFNMQDKKNREDYRELFQIKIKELKNFALKYEIALNFFCTDSKRKNDYAT